MTYFLLGAISMAAAVCGLVFLRYFIRTRDRFFLWFALAFWIEALGRVLFLVSPEVTDDSITGYVLRIVTYGMILLAILQKNLPRRG